MSEKLSGGNLANRSDKATRRKLDFYPTPMEVTGALMEFIKLKKGLIWEPACGEGYMSEILKLYGHDVYSSELNTETSYACNKGRDFLKYENIYANAIITNPPFHIAEEFIRKALSFSPIVAMLLKSQYWHAKKRVSLFEEFPPAYVLPLSWRPDFSGGNSPTMEVAWTVWIEGNTSARYQPLDKPDMWYLF